MAKQKNNHAIKEEPSSFVMIRNSIYLLIPSGIQQDSSFPFKDEKADRARKVNVQMHEDRIVVTRE